MRKGKYKLSMLKQLFMPDIVLGHQTSIKHLFRKPVTLEYPKERYETPPRFRGILELIKDENGEEICNGCSLCQRVCPVDCIYIEKEGKGKTQKAKVFDLDLSRCMFCNLCVEACPSDCLKMEKFYEESCSSREDLMLDKEGMYKVREFVKYKK